MAEKTDGGWIYAWLKNPRDFSPHTAMPSLRLSDHEATALAAYLMTMGSKKIDPNIEQTLANPIKSPRASRWCASTAASDAMKSTGWRRSRASALS